MAGVEYVIRQDWFTVLGSYVTLSIQVHGNLVIYLFSQWGKANSAVTPGLQAGALNTQRN